MTVRKLTLAQYSTKDLTQMSPVFFTNVLFLCQDPVCDPTLHLVAIAF